MDSCHKQEDNSLPRLNTIMTQTQKRDFIAIKISARITQPYSKQELKKMISKELFLFSFYQHFNHYLQILFRIGLCNPGGNFNCKKI